MVGRSNKRKVGGLFRTRSIVEPAIVIKEINEETGTEEEFVEVIIPKKKVKKCLAGERLLLKLAKQKSKSEVKKEHTNQDVVKLTLSINRILKDF